MQKLPTGISLDTISDGYDSGRIGEAKSLRVYLDFFWKVGPKTLDELLEKLARSGYPIDCLICDSFMPWAMEVARSFGIVGVLFLTQNMVVNSIYYHVHLGKLQAPLTENEISLPAQPPLQLGDMPSFFFNYVEDPAFLDFLVDKHTKDEEDYGVEQVRDEECIKWLDDKPKEVVVYVSFGSMAVLEEEQIEELAYGLRESGSYFLWVVRESEETKLPKGFEKKSEKGLVVPWCSQLKVLAHEAVGCFVTHCGWNSTLEALCLGVPMVAMPQEADQSTNAKHIEDVWKVGTKASVDGKHWKTVAANAVGEGGTMAVLYMEAVVVSELWKLGMTSQLDHGDGSIDDSASTPIHFFRIMLPHNLLQGTLRLPTRFVSKYGKHLSNTVHLKLPNGAEWKVNLEKRDGSVWFQQGWKEFAEYHSLAYGHLLVFRFNLTSHFHVSICNKSCMEIDYPINKANHKRTRINSEDIQPPKTQKTTQNKKKCNSNFQDTAFDKKARDHKGRLKNPNEGKRNMEAVGNTSFTVIMKSHHFTLGQMYVPHAPIKSCIKSGEQFVTLLVGDRSWRVKLRNYRSKSVSYFTTNWSAFARENNLKKGDACLFQLLHCSDNMVMKVSISRKMSIS
ncbi:unnamed protein product [Sphenostylis stenocarpa]|uniref:TF-B3 domain-containing protein n=1 Tax=Sphenostylis stenocarpa TaxID=92480 RepID=A0AA86RKM4_9FABA|nr:unnamed protein product [Sphenostylis stenocarpa]